LIAAGYGKVEKRVRTTGGGATGSVRNLRIREDTAKYLLNLDPNSAHYDPKSRSMREDPQPHKAKKAFAGDNFVRKSGDYHGWEAERLHQLAAYDHGASLHMQAAPSQAEILHQHFKNKKDKLQVSICAFEQCFDWSPSALIHGQMVCLLVRWWAAHVAMPASMCSLGFLFIWLPKQIIVHQMYRTNSGFVQNLFLLEASVTWVLSSFCCVGVSTHASSVALQLLLSFCSLTACALFSNSQDWQCSWGLLTRSICLCADAHTDAHTVVMQLKNKDTIMQQYGDAAEKAPEDGLLLGQTERYVEYDAAGRVVKGQDIKAHSRYEEDTHPNNHTSVWGSWWEGGQWGYACCHQTIKNSYCTGEAGLVAAEAQADQMQLNIERKAEEDKAREENGGNLEVCAMFLFAILHVRHFCSCLSVVPSCKP